MNSRQKLHSAAVLRILESVGVIGKATPATIVSKNFELHKTKKQQIWGGQVKVDDSSSVFLFYSKLNNIKYLVVKLIGSVNSAVLWYVVCCGDETGQEDSLNSIFTELIINADVAGETKIVELSTFDLCKFLMGFEIIRDYIGYVLPIENIEQETINKIIEFGELMFVDEETDA